MNTFIIKRGNRKHHNTDGRERIRRGIPEKQMKELAKKLKIKYGGGDKNVGTKI